MKWTAQDIPSQTGRLAVITGSNSGIGFAAARELARAGAHVVMACRNADKAKTAVASLQVAVPDASVEVQALDLSSLASVRDFAERFSREHQALDLLINNAGIMASPRRLTADGFESQLGTNHLGHFALTAQLLPKMQGRQDARVVNVSSGAHRGGQIDFDDLQGERRYGRWRAYSQSKLANLMFTYELDRRLRRAGSTVGSFAAHPGWAATNLQAAETPAYAALFAGIANAIFAQSADMGALPTLYAATYPGLASGTYAGPDGMFEGRGHPQPVQPAAAARDETAARRLWEVSEQLTGATFNL
jgi:NAD(P)-dependent dehydrogenase (short-subunit alcohol dehydrogenase family)